VEAPDGPLEIGFRPECARFSAEGVPCRVLRAVYRGATTRYHLEAAGRTVLVDSQGSPGPCIEVTEAFRLEDA
jgi:hypothetical protein